MTRLQDRIEAFAKYAAAGMLSTSSTAGSMTHDPEREERSSGTVGEISGPWLPNLEAIQLLEQVLSSVESRESTSSVWTARQAELPSEGISRAESPFDLLYERRENQEKVRELISYIRSTFQVPFAQELSPRLESLRKVAEEEAPDQSELSAASLQMFITFLELAPNLKPPGVVLSPSGNVRAQWRGTPNKLFVAEFYPDGEVRLVIFRPDPDCRGHTIRLSGTGSVGSLLSIAEPHGVLEWAGR